MEKERKERDEYRQAADARAQRLIVQEDQDQGENDEERVKMRDDEGKDLDVDMGKYLYEIPEFKPPKEQVHISENLSFINIDKIIIIRE